MSGQGRIRDRWARGKGYVYQHGYLIVKSTPTPLAVGLQAGGQAYSEVIFLEDKAALDNFKRGRLKLDAGRSSRSIPYRRASVRPQP